MTYYVYGMRLRGRAPGCQPKNGFVCGVDLENHKYHSIITYDRELTSDECAEYELDYLDKMEAGDKK